MYNRGGIVWSEGNKVLLELMAKKMVEKLKARPPNRGPFHPTEVAKMASDVVLENQAVAIALLNSNVREEPPIGNPPQEQLELEELISELLRQKFNRSQLQLEMAKRIGGEAGIEVAFAEHQKAVETILERYDPENPCYTSSIDPSTLKVSVQLHGIPRDDVECRNEVRAFKKKFIAGYEARAAGRELTMEQREKCIDRELGEHVKELVALMLKHGRCFDSWELDDDGRTPIMMMCRLNKENHEQMLATMVKAYAWKDQGLDKSGDDVLSHGADQFLRGINAMLYLKDEFNELARRYDGEGTADDGSFEAALKSFRDHLNQIENPNQIENADPIENPNQTENLDPIENPKKSINMVRLIQGFFAISAITAWLYQMYQ